ncbi:hypothetical protein AB0B01_12120 [Streptomyces sp. NPDC044571]|uniref:hypothetical protein n=1 Tax=Streptomyces sp. NPDC044571 TaxID=3155371 RepID=UPI0033FCC6D3
MRRTKVLGTVLALSAALVAVATSVTGDSGWQRAEILASQAEDSGWQNPGPRIATGTDGPNDDAGWQ